MLLKEYAALRKVSVQSVTKRLRENNPPPAIKSWRKFGNTYDLEVDIKELMASKMRKEKV